MGNSLKKEDIVLVGINAKYSHTNPAIRYIKRFMNDRAGMDVDLMEFTINQRVDEIIRRIIESGARVVCFSAYIWNIDMIIEIATKLKEIDENLIVAVGGPEVSYDADSPLYRVMDHVFTGEGEESFLRFVEKLGRGESIERVIAGGNLAELDDIGFIYTDIADLSNRIIYYESSRGCPYNCSYCLSSSTKGVRYASIGKVKEDLRIFVENRVMQVKFVDRTFNADPGRAVDIMRFITEIDNGYTSFHFEVTAPILDESTMALLETMREGLIQFEMGLQTTNEESISEIGRNVDWKETLEKCKRVVGIGKNHVHLDLIAGLPYEGFASFMESMDDAFSSGPHMLQIGFLKLLKGSRIRLEREKHGYRFSYKAPYEVFSNRYVSYGEMSAIKDIEELIDMTYNADFLRGSFTAISRHMFGGSMSRAYHEASVFLRERGVLGSTNSRGTLVSTMIDFVRSREPGPKDALCELMIYESCLGGVRNISEFGAIDFQLMEKGEREAVHGALQDRDFVASLCREYGDLKPRDILKRVVAFKVKCDIMKFISSGYEAAPCKEGDGLILVASPAHKTGGIITYEHI